MYDSKVSVAEVVRMLESEVDIQSAIDYNSCARWITSLEQLIYTDIVKDYRSTEVLLQGDVLCIDQIFVEEGYNKPTFDEIVKVYDEIDELVRCGPIAAHQFSEDKPIYWNEGETVHAKILRDGVDHLLVIFKARPEIKMDESADTVKVPYEWLEMVLSKVRGEAYKIAGDDAQAAKWLNDYNTQLESFKAWCNERQKWFGE